MKKKKITSYFDLSESKNNNVKLEIDHGWILVATPCSKPRVFRGSNLLDVDEFFIEDCMETEKYELMCTLYEDGVKHKNISKITGFDIPFIKQYVYHRSNKKRVKEGGE